MIIYVMIFLGSALMVYNIYGFIRYAIDIQKDSKWGKEKRILYIPIILLIFFLFGYIFVGVFGNPDLMMAGILFGGSVFVFIMYRVIRRITQQIQEKEHLETELRTAEQSSVAKTRFLASISHEMRTPLNVIMGMQKLAISNPDLPEETRTQLDNIGLSAEHLLSLINYILDLNYIESGELSLKNEGFIMSRVIKQIVIIGRSSCKEKGITWNMIGEAPETAAYLGDDTRLKQILFCVLDNAVKYTESGGSITFTVDKKEYVPDVSTYTFIVEDTGIGIDPDFLPKIFDTFSQEDTSSTTSYSGIGLGLAVAKNITELMGGSISAESEKGKGTKMTIVIPFTEAEEAEEKHGDDTEEVSLEGRRILIVEDIEINAEIVTDLLELEGAECELAQNGQIAVDMISESPEGYYDAILMDLRMPVMDGFEAVRRIRDLDRKDTATVPIIALTANAFEEDVDKALNVGMNMHLAKPVDADLLYGTLKRLIGRSQNE